MKHRIYSVLMRSEHSANLALADSSLRIGSTFHKPAPVRKLARRLGLFARIVRALKGN